MKTIVFLLVLIISFQTVSSQLRKRIHIPDIPGYKTLQCDFHMHTVFSDGTVWPTVRVEEAYREGLDVISITEHLEGRPHSNDIYSDHNRSYDIAKEWAEKRDIILIKGAEMTKKMPPGHINTLFITDANPLLVKDYNNGLVIAEKQNAFFVWCHPGWYGQQPDTIKWFDVHTRLFNEGFINAIEIVNHGEYWPEVHQWCIDKNITMLGVTDAHEPVHFEYDIAGGKHRPMTLVFSKTRNEEGVRQALENRRTVVFNDDLLIGFPDILEKLFKSCITMELTEFEQAPERTFVKITNHSDLLINLSRHNKDKSIQYPRNFTIPKKGIQFFELKTDEKKGKYTIGFVVDNFYSHPDKGMYVEMIVR